MTASNRIVRVVNPAGLHARPCHAIVATAMGYECSVRIRARDAAGEPGVNGKSILELMTLEAGPGTELEILGEGEGVETLLDDLASLFERGFDE